MHGGKAAFANEGQAFRKLRLGFPGEAHDHVRGHGAAREGGLQQRHALVVAGRVVFPPHPGQHRVGAGLHGQVEMGTEVFVGGHDPAKGLVNDPGLQGAQPDPHRGNRGADGVQQLHKGAAIVEIPAPGGDFDAGDHDLPVALRSQLLCLRHGLCQGQTPHRPPGVGDDAVGAEVGAAVLDLQHGPGPGGETAGGQNFKLPPLQSLVQGLPSLPVGHGLQGQLQKGLPPGGAGDHVHTQVPDILRLHLAVAAADRHHRPGTLLSDPADHVAVFLVRHGGDRAGVDDRQVKGPVGPHLGVAPLGQPLLHGLGLILIDLAA